MEPAPDRLRHRVHALTTKDDAACAITAIMQAMAAKISSSRIKCIKMILQFFLEKRGLSNQFYTAAHANEGQLQVPPEGCP